MRSFLLILFAVAISLQTISAQQETNSTETSTAKTTQINAAKNDVKQEYLLPRFKKDWYFQRYRNWVIDNIVYPQDCIDEGIEGRVVVVFVIDVDGVIRTAEVAQTPDKRLSDELIRVVKSEKWHMPARQWNAEKNAYVPVQMRSIIPITFNLPQEKHSNNSHLSFDMMQSEFDNL